MIAQLFIIILVLLIVYKGVDSMRKPKKFPPGPHWYPFIGCNLLVNTYIKKYGSQWRAISMLRQEYDTDVLGLKLGNEAVVVFFSSKNIYKMFHEKEFEGRPDTFFAKMRCLGTRTGITFADGPEWKRQRLVTVKHLRHIGFGKSSMEVEIQNETHILMKKLCRQSSDKVYLRNVLAQSVLNVLWIFIAGEQIKEESLNHMLDLFERRSKAFSMAGGWLNLFPWARYLFPNWTGFNIIKELNTEISNVIEAAIEKHKNKTIMADDFIYSYLKEMQECSDNEYTEQQLKVICLDMLIAGSQTTSNTLLFAILVVLRNKSIQDKIFDEVHTLLGDQMPSLSDSNRLLYTSAFLNEVNRYYTIAPLVGPRRVLSDVVVDGYHIPKETTILSSSGDLHFDPEVWKEPEQFKPERFIDETGVLINPDNFYPFGSGRRRCPGDSLAKCFIFITFVTIIQKFKIQCANGVMPSAEPVIGILSAPQPFLADFVVRDHFRDTKM